MEQHIEYVETAECSPLLNEIHKPPQGLFVWGTIPDKTRLNIAFVGARMYTTYGKKACETLIDDLSTYPVTIVSGLALGIDTIAHRKALEVGLPTIAVVGSGLSKEVLYPRTHFSVAKDIVKQGGAVISEYSSDTPSASYRFPQRNRIIAGMCQIVVIVECAIKSGTMITARLALESNRDVFVVPHSLFSLSGEGPLNLIDHGAHLALNGHAIAQALGLEKRTYSATGNSNITEEEQVFLTHIKKPITRNDLIREAGIPPEVVQALIIRLEIKKVIREEGGLIYRNT